MNRQTYNKVCEELGFTPRDEQFMLINSVQENFNLAEANPRELAIFESPTGTGKSLAYLLASCDFLSENPSTAVTIVTATRQLQLQILEEFNSICRLYPNVKLQILQGQGNYLSLYRLKRLISLYEKNEDEKAKEILPLLHTLGEIASRDDICGNLTLIDANYDILKKLEELGVDTDYLACLSSYSNGHKKTNQEHLFYYEKAKALANEANIVVTNYQMFFMAKFNFPSHVVLDEAHQMIDEAIRTWSKSLALSTLAYTLKVLSKLKDDFSLTDRQNLQKASYEISQRIKAIIELSKQDARENLILSGGNTEDPFIKFLIEIIQEIYYIAKRANTIVHKAKSDIDEVNDFIEKFKKLENIYFSLVDQKILKDSFCYLMTFSLVEKYPSLHAISPKGAPKLHRFFMKEQYRDKIDGAKSICLLSGTLMDIFQKDRPFEWLIKQGGLSNFIKECHYFPKLTRKFRGFDFKKKIKVYFYENIPFYTFNDELENPSLDSIREYILGISDTVKEIIEKAKNKVLILTTSHIETILLREKIKEEISEDIFSFVPYEKNLTGTLQKVKQDFENHEGKAVLITASAWQGFNIVSDVSDLVITRIPYVSPSDPMIVAQKHATLNSNGGSQWEAERKIYIITRLKTAIRLLQGIGRFARHENSKGNIHLLDRRLLDRSNPFAKEIKNALADRYSCVTVEKEEALVKK